MDVVIVGNTFITEAGIYTLYNEEYIFRLFMEKGFNDENTRTVLRGGMSANHDGGVVYKTLEDAQNALAQLILKDDRNATLGVFVVEANWGDGTYEFSDHDTDEMHTLLLNSSKMYLLDHNQFARYVKFVQVENAYVSDGIDE